MSLPSLRHVVKLCLTTLSAVCALITPAAGQTEPPPAVGARVRVVLPAAAGHAERYVIGRLFHLGKDSVLILTGDFGARQDTLAFALGEGGSRLERPVAGQGHGRTGAALGAVVGAITGAAIGTAAYRPCEPQGFFACIMYPSEAEQTAAYAVLGGAGGALVGLIIGSSIRSERWMPVSGVSAHVMLAPGVVGIRLAF
ncbi:MAG TPA: hypothetical protein VN908_08365 [Gemmatimonadales bacterium]|nr:hypothetical protein [Gemmatimonadales bacterium]